jgi:hypothetical protein
VSSDTRRYWSLRSDAQIVTIRLTLRLLALLAISVAALLVGVAQVDVATAESAAGTTTHPAGAKYDYERAAPNAQSARASIPLLLGRMAAPIATDAAGRSANARVAGLLAAQAEPEVALTRPSRTT